MRLSSITRSDSIWIGSGCVGTRSTRKLPCCTTGAPPSVTGPSEPVVAIRNDSDPRFEPVPVPLIETLPIVDRPEATASSLVPKNPSGPRSMPAVMSDSKKFPPTVTVPRDAVRTLSASAPDPPKRASRPRSAPAMIAESNTDPVTSTLPMPSRAETNDSLIDAANMLPTDPAERKAVVLIAPKTVKSPRSDRSMLTVPVKSPPIVIPVEP